ncbi:MAG: putative bifunctional diguanylate cyclase/phosphodiesterase [Acidimicrobiales bacterium]
MSQVKPVTGGADASSVEAALPADPQFSTEPLWTRLRQRAADPAIMANPPVAAAFCLLRAFHLIAPLPYWLLVVVVFVGGTIAIVSAAVLGDFRHQWHMPAYVAVNMGVITVVAYATGWGPILSIGFVFGAGSAMQLFGSRATRWLMHWTVVWMVLGQTAIGLHLAPTLIRQPLVHGLAGLSLLGTLLTIALIGRVTAAREDVEAELRQSERRFKALVRNAADIIMVVNDDGLLQYVSPAFERILGISPEPYYAQSTGNFIHPDDLLRINTEMPELAAHPEQVLHTQLRIRDSAGSWRHFEATVTNRREDPDVRGIVGNLHDITALIEAHERFRSAFEDAPIGMALATLDGLVIRSNRAYGAILARAPEDLVGLTIGDFTHPDDRDRTDAAMRAIAERRSDGYELEKRFVRPDGQEVWTHVHVSCVRDSSGEPQYLIGQIQDVSEQRTMRERLAHAAIHDPLTGLPNRVLFMDRLSMALSRAERSGSRVAIAFLDLDRFKLVNDGLGHASGDVLLEAVAQRLRNALRTEDTVARFGGDEFTILWEDLRHEDEALVVARRILEELQQPIELDGAVVFVTASIGLAVADSQSTPSSMLRDADTAMYLAKEGGRSRVEVFDGRSHAVALESLNVINELHGALARHEFVLHYQPIVDLRDGATVAVEALVRWEHPERGLLLPGQFIEVAEECGLIVPLGTWVLQEACRQAAQWHRRAPASPAPLEVHVNISPRQLVSPGFVAGVEAALVESGIHPGTLCLEITEGTLMHDERVSSESLRDLRALGVRISIDDFGTGYSSLSYLKRFPIDSLKVDRTFVDGLGEDPDDSVIVSAVVALAHSLAITAVAEGVETEIALAELQRLGCDRAQGFLVGHPQPAAAVEAQLFEAELTATS